MWGNAATACTKSKAIPVVLFDLGLCEWRWAWRASPLFAIHDPLDLLRRLFPLIIVCASIIIPSMAVADILPKDTSIDCKEEIAQVLNVDVGPLRKA